MTLKPPFDLNEFKYETDGYYPAFKAGTDEKICAAMVSGALAGSLRKEGLVYGNENASIPVADIGSGPADSIQMYLKGAGHQGGFEIHATDYSANYAGPNGLAHQNLTAAQSASGHPKINSFSVTRGDAFDGKLIQTMQVKPEHFQLAYISHMLYHTAPEKVETMLKDVSHNLLARDGVCVAYHLENVQDSFQYFRGKYGRKADSMEGSDTPSMQVENPPQAIEEACQKNNIPCHTMHYINQYYFAPMKEKYWEMFKHPEQYARIKGQALENLRKLYFIHQVAANQFAADTTPTGLSAFIDEVRGVIAPDAEKFQQSGGYMNLAETVQIIGSAKATDETKEKLERVAEDLQQQLPALAEQSFQEWKKGRKLA